MKTLNEKLLDMKSEFDLVGTKFNGITWQTIERNMQEYATEYAKEALRLASENATVECDGDEFSHSYIVYKQSILSENNLPKHR